ncbi:MAG: hypothetical protein M1817_001143 [Caeruleum heppii]|nr:MAG: hypothetical protein M1817_001143 [Caeruleum heppii]
MSTTTTRPPSSSLMHLPPELHLRITPHLPYPDLLALQCASRYFASLFPKLSPYEQLSLVTDGPGRCERGACGNCDGWTWAERVAIGDGGGDKGGKGGGEDGGEEERSRHEDKLGKGEGQEVVLQSSNTADDEKTRGYAAWKEEQLEVVDVEEGGGNASHEVEEEAEEGAVD